MSAGCAFVSACFRASGARLRPHFTCFPGTKVQILTRRTRRCEIKAAFTDEEAFSIAQLARFICAAVMGVALLSHALAWLVAGGLCRCVRVCMYIIYIKYIMYMIYITYIINVYIKYIY